LKSRHAMQTAMQTAFLKDAGPLECRAQGTHFSVYKFTPGKNEAESPSVSFSRCCRPARVRSARSAPFRLRRSRRRMRLAGRPRCRSRRICADSFPLCRAAGIPASASRTSNPWYYPPPPHPSSSLALRNEIVMLRRGY